MFRVSNEFDNDTTQCRTIIFSALIFLVTLTICVAAYNILTTMSYIEHGYTKQTLVGSADAVWVK